MRFVINIEGVRFHVTLAECRGDDGGALPVEDAALADRLLDLLTTPDAPSVAQPVAAEPAVMPELVEVVPVREGLATDVAIGQDGQLVAVEATADLPPHCRWVNGEIVCLSHLAQATCCEADCSEPVDRSVDRSSRRCTLHLRDYNAALNDL